MSVEVSISALLDSSEIAENAVFSVFFTPKSPISSGLEVTILALLDAIASDTEVPISTLLKSLVSDVEVSVSALLASRPGTIKLFT